MTAVRIEARRKFQLRQKANADKRAELCIEGFFEGLSRLRADPNRYAYALFRRHAILGGKPATLAELAKELNLSRNRVRQILAKAYGVAGRWTYYSREQRAARMAVEAVLARRKRK